MGVLHNIRLAPPPVSCRPLTTGGQVKETLGLRPTVRPSVPARARPVTGNQDRKAQCHPCTGQRGRRCQQNNWKKKNWRNYVGWQHLPLVAIFSIANVMSSGKLSERKWGSIGVGWSWLPSTYFLFFPLEIANYLLRPRAGQISGFKTPDVQMLFLHLNFLSTSG